MSDQTKLKDLWTREGELLQASDETPWDVYPRPRMVRDSFINLNGWWDFAATEDVRPPLRFDRKIRVPFMPESLLSGIHEPIRDGSWLWYRREVKALLKEGERLILHVGAADQEATLWIDSKRVELSSGYAPNRYTHVGGYEAFSADITDYLKPSAQGVEMEYEAELLIQVHDQLEGGKHPYGKQSLNRGGIWYTPCSGIWQTVWAEVVPEFYIQDISVETIPEDGIPAGTVTPDGPWLVRIHSTLSNGETLDREERIEEPHLWSPEDPYLYQTSVEVGEDRVETYYALRTITSAKVGHYWRLLLNGRPYFFHGLLDQGYWSDGLFTPACPEQMTEEIARLKELGFNMLRKHIKVEPELFYYECDRQGMAVFQDCVQNGIYNFRHDTALPTLGLLKLNDQKWQPDPESRENFVEGMLAMVRQLKEHPSVVYWTIFNEGWGQFSGTQMYMQLKHEDETRPIDTASGWFHYSTLKTDVESRHVYFRRVRPLRTGRPWVLSEFGGYGYMMPEHAANPDHAFGYRRYGSREDLAKALRKLYEQEIIPLVGRGLCASVYTQVSDVEDETNGLFTYDRRVQKIRPEDLSGIWPEIQRMLEQ